MYSQDWVDHMKLVMEHGAPGDVYEVQRVNFAGPTGTWGGGGSCYVKTEAGYRSCLLANAEITGVKDAPYRI